MKIQIIKSDTEPRHSLTKKDLQLVLEVVPKEWIGIKHVFLLSDREFKNTTWDSPVKSNNTTFTILSRGIEKHQIIKELLIKLAEGPSKTSPYYGGRYSNEQRRKLEEYIAPYFEKVLERLNT